MSLNENVRLNDPVQTINYQLDNEIIILMTSGFKIRCRRLLLGFSPTLLSSISFIPSLPLNKSCSMIMGQCIKTIFIYSKPFWKNIQINSNENKGPCSNIFESTNPICLIGLILGDDAAFWKEKSEDELIESIRKQYSLLYKINENPLESYLQYWNKEHFSKGCYAAIYPPTLLSTWLEKNKPLINQRIWLASTEMALQWIGYIEGAIEAGQRSAQHIFNSL
jgi:monoamine oxidase